MEMFKANRLGDLNLSNKPKQIRKQVWCIGLLLKKLRINTVYYLNRLNKTLLNEVFDLIWAKPLLVKFNNFSMKNYLLN